MTGAKKLRTVSVEEYLSIEESSEVKHEYVDGAIYAMAGASNAHNIISSNSLISLGSKLRGHSCRALNSDTKIRLRMPTETRFYYADASVICRANPQSDTFQDEPAIIIEVLSASMRRIDEGEKKDAYLTISSLFLYMLVEQDAPAVVAYRRTNKGFLREEFKGLEDVILLPELKTEMTLSELYDGVELLPSTEE